MADTPPQLGNIQHPSEIKVPGLSASTNGEPLANKSPASNATESLQSAKNTVMNSRLLPTSTHNHGTERASDAQAAANSIANHPTTQNLKESVQNAPVTEAARDQAAKTKSEASNLAASRKTPATTTVNNQALTHYHSFFYTLLSWENPRMTGLAFVATLVAIFAVRYLPVVRWVWKGAYVVLGIAALAEGAGRLVLSKGLAGSIRPRRYYTIDREFLEATLEDVEQFTNFFCIEAQRLAFAENLVHTTSAFVASLLIYWLLKFTPPWGIALIGACVVYLAPLIYITNQEVIDDLLAQASQLVSDQTAQIRDLAGQHTAKATETLKGYAGEYSAKAQEMMGSRGGMMSASPTSKSKPAAVKQENPPAYSAGDFPTAPKQVPAAPAAAPFKSDPLAA